MYVDVHTYIDAHYVYVYPTPNFAQLQASTKQAMRGLFASASCRLLVLGVQPASKRDSNAYVYVKMCICVSLFRSNILNTYIYVHM